LGIGATGPRKKLDDIFSPLDTIHERDGLTSTDGRTNTGRQQRPRLRMASRGKNDMTIQLSLSIHFYLVYLLFNSSEGNEAKTVGAIRLCKVVVL